MPVQPAALRLLAALSPVDEPERFVREMEAAGFALRIDDPDFVRRISIPRT